MWGKVILYYLISSFILYRIDSGNCYIGGRMEIKIDQHNIGNMVVVGSGVVMVMTMVINNKWLLCLRIHTYTYTYPHSHPLRSNTLSLLELWIYKIAHY